MTHARWLVGVAAVAWFGAGTARAGALGKVVNGLDHATGNDDHGRGSGGGATTDDHRGEDNSPSGPSYADDDGFAVAPTDPTAPLVVSGPYPMQPGGDVNVRLYLGLQSVVDSDGAAAISMRASHGDYGFSLADTSYFEAVPQLDGSEETLRLDVWAIAVAARTVDGGHSDPTVWLQGGVGGVASSTDSHAIGAVVGAEVDQPLSPALSLSGSARLFLLQDDVRGGELAAGVSASILRVSYRVLKLNVGPALRGPEVGLVFQF